MLPMFNCIDSHALAFHHLPSGCSGLFFDAQNAAVRGFRLVGDDVGEDHFCDLGRVGASRCPTSGAIRSITIAAEGRMRRCRPGADPDHF
jgi:hypothetical protein